MWAGRAWANGTLTDRDQPQSELSEEARAFGIDPAKLARSDNDAGLWSEHVAATSAFISIQSQMRFLALGMSGKVRALGLDYSGAKAGLELAGVKVTPLLWGQIQLIETGAKNAINEAIT